MKNKKKTKFQKYLERTLSNDTNKPFEMNEVQKLTNTERFYRRNLKDFHEVESKNGMRMYKGSSADGNCIVTEQGGIYCKETGFIGHPVDFILSQEKNLTLFGAYDRYFTSVIRTFNGVEGEYADVLDEDSLFGKINSFRHDYSSVEKLKSFGLEKETVDKYPFWFDGRQRFFYLHLNSLNYPLCKHEWSFDGDSYHDSVFGVPKMIESPDADRIYFVENPMQLVSLSEVYPEPIYVRPTAINYLYHDFNSLIRGKQVICIKAKKQRNADITNFDLTFLESEDPLELLYVYEQGEPKDGNLTESDLRFILSDMIDSASASIKLYLKKA